ncbi:TPA: MBL fold metallo-hydrolase [Enterobacter cloacae]|uniref:Linear primary-alkylsulfatase n=1 Tax=Enterobacter cloacae TaxID=550 RepID=A0AAW6SAS4_ENTCL|nr:alkyl sulfatase dimerization domain-containing protein [Enterobacter cloacae]AVL17880.1 alkyl/aryl-sulfatase [Enterobacter cloacae]KTJ71313.1 alkyl sulfatase [Enterobacter cloacae subsp. cloacae]MCL8189815.1 MBL fold metallo-hydrolase [Enterobacter cloacae]MCM8138174.1 MBL fold metallo-hydrolase [Enterobacter cloacae]MDH0197564.1 MBL fold metallo-hydrolase [Enterobacter cloacae]
MKLKNVAFLMLTLAASVQACATSVAPSASAYTREHNAAMYQQLNFNDKRDIEDAKRGFIATINPLLIKNDNGKTVVNLENWAFLKGEAPDTVNPSLWRHAQLNNINGLFKVTDRVYQIRGIDISNMTIIEGNSGLIIIDPLVIPESARAGLELYYQHRPKKPVVAVIYSHSHLDHFGGVKGVVSETDVKSGKVKIYAPEGFMEEAASENFLAGNAMSRRALYMYAMMVKPSAVGHVDDGIGKTIATSKNTLIAPTNIISQPEQRVKIDGVEVNFILAPGTEAPSEMMMWFPQFKVFDGSELFNATMHNLYTLRGAKARSAVNWWKALDKALVKYGDQVEIALSQHLWPVWDNARVKDYIASQRDMYKYINDQSLNLINKGYSMDEVAETLTLPDSIGKRWFNRGYYGSLSHNAKAMYMFYMGWYDSNPANLNPLPEKEAAPRYVRLMGGEKKVYQQAKQAADSGNYRWAAQLLNHLLFANPDNKQAKDLQADIFTQLGYQSENAIWRNEYLSGAKELRDGVPVLPVASTLDSDLTANIEPEALLDYMGVMLNGPKADGKNLRFNWTLSAGDTYGVELNNSVIIYHKGLPFTDAAFSLKASVVDMARLISHSAPVDKILGDGTVSLKGNPQKLDELLALLDVFPQMFNIVTP